MWWDDQNLDKPRRDQSGKRWNVRVWHDVVRIDGNLVHVARVFFWDDKRETTGVRLFEPGDNTHVTNLRAFIEKLVASPKIRSNVPQGVALSAGAALFGGTAPSTRKPQTDDPLSSAVTLPSFSGSAKSLRSNPTLVRWIPPHRIISVSRLHLANASGPCGGRARLALVADSTAASALTRPNP